MNRVNRAEGKITGTKIPGELVNRPRYTINPLFIIGFVMWYNFCCVGIINDELRWTIIPLVKAISFNDLAVFIVFMNLFGIDVECVSFVEMRAKAKDVYAEFLRATKLRYMGKHMTSLNPFSGVMHPVDHFVKHFYDRLFPKQCAHAFAAYKRTNPTLRLKLDHLEEYAEPRLVSIPADELCAETDGLVKELLDHPRISVLREDVRQYVSNKSFELVDLDGSSASGFPYPQGKKKRETNYDAMRQASDMIDDDVAFATYTNDHVWYSTGRARMQKLSRPDASRLIIYAGHAYLFVVMLVLQPWSRFMNSAFSWCGVGFSWMNGGAGKLAHQFKCQAGFAPVGFRYVTLDISGWDTKLHRDLMLMLPRFYCAILRKFGISESYIWRFDKLVRMMIEASVLMPLGHLFKVMQGMKSGWGATANDNTLMHELVFRCIMRRIGHIQHVLYGDDNFMLVPDSISDDILKSEYARFGLLIKVIHSSRCISDVDFLSKRIMFKDGHYYVFRDSVETHSRILMPEEADPRRRDRPHAVVTSEHVLGHLLDNPFNDDVRDVCYEILGRLKRDYGIMFVEVHDATLKKHPWRWFDPEKIPRKFPIVPDLAFIEDLYGVPIPATIGVRWPNVPVPIGFDRNGSDLDCELFDAAAVFSNDVMTRMSQLAGKKAKFLVSRISPYKQPVRCYGFHAARFEFAIKYFKIRFNSLLDLGSHPGACAASASKFCSHIVCVSKLPEKDKRGFCPYVMRDPTVKLIRADADRFVPNRFFDLQHDDVDIVGRRSFNDDVAIARGMIRRARMNKDWTGQVLFTVKETDSDVATDLYLLYLDFGHIDFVKPLFSNPWKTEFMVYCQRKKGARMRKRTFFGMYNKFLNSMAPQMFSWTECMASAINGFEGVGKVPFNTMQSDASEKEWLVPWEDSS